MQKKTYTAINLSCTLQQDSELTFDKCLNGVISKTADGFRFEEGVRKGSYKRNLKLFEGDFVSLVHQADGKYKCHLRSITASKDLNRQQLAFKVYSELLRAFEIID